MKKSITLMAAAMLLLVGIQVHAAVKTNEAAPDFTLVDTSGQEHSLSSFKGKYVVLEWVNFECPFVKKHYQSGNMQSLQEQLKAQDVVWLTISSSAEGKQGYYSPEEINEILTNSEASPAAYLLDVTGDVGRLYGAKTTPHMFIINPEGVLIYQGAIDDKPTFDPADIPGSNNYVLSALTAAKAGSPIADATTTPYGCSVKY